MAASPWILAWRSWSPSLPCSSCPPSPGCSHSGRALSGDTAQKPATFCGEWLATWAEPVQVARWVDQPSPARLSHARPGTGRVSEYISGWFSLSETPSHPHIMEQGQALPASSCPNSWRAESGSLTGLGCFPPLGLGENLSVGFLLWAGKQETTKFILFISGCSFQKLLSWLGGEWGQKGAG